MPELPEVETIRRDLDKVLKKRRITKVTVHKTKILRGIKSKDFIKKLKGDTFTNVWRRGKFLILDLKSGRSLLIHLKMTGSLRYGKEVEPQYAWIIWDLDNGYKLWYSDPRLFGRIELLYTKDLPLSDLKYLGPEPLSTQFSLEKFKVLLSKRRGRIKPLLLNQNFLAGLGNIYATESFFLAGINPKRAADSLSDKEIKKLYKFIRQVLSRAITYRGTSVDRYVDAAGEKGSFQNKLYVYDREGEPCFRCGKPIKRIELGGRGTYFCNTCQPFQPRR